MKKIYFFFLLFLLGNSINAQKELTGFLNIPFGSNIDFAKKIILKKPGAKFVNEEKIYADQNSEYYMRMLLFSSIPIGEFRADSCALISDIFIKDKFVLGVIWFNNFSEELQSALLDILTYKYGYANKSEYDDGVETQYWFFDVPKGEEKNKISLERVFKGNRKRISLSYYGFGTIKTKFKNPIIEEYNNKTKEF